MPLQKMLLLAVVVALVGVNVGETTTTAEPNLSIDIASVDPEAPTTDNDIRIDVALSNLETSSGPVEVTSAYLREDGTAETIVGEALSAVEGNDLGENVRIGINPEFLRGECCLGLFGARQGRSRLAD